MELKSCPFCGGPARVFQKHRDPKPLTLNWRIFCDNNDCPMDVMSDFETKAEAVAAWNRRSAPAIDAGAREAARRIVTLKNDGAPKSMGGVLAWARELEDLRLHHCDDIARALLSLSKE